MTITSGTLATPSLSDTIPNATPVTTTLMAIAQLLGLSQSWVDEQEVMGKRVARWRKLYDGDHDMPLSTFQKELLQVKDSDDGMAVNLMKNVIDMPTNRTIVQAIEGVEDNAPDMTEQPGPATPDNRSSMTVAGMTMDMGAGVNALGKQILGVPPTQPQQPKKPIVNDSTRWAQEVSENNHFDVIQSEVHESAYRDGNSYLLVEWDNDDKQVKFCPELAWDGQSGVLMVYKSKSIYEPYAALKVWQIDGLARDGNSLDVTTRLNVYYADRVEKFVTTGQGGTVGGFTPYVDTDEYSAGGVNGVYKWDLVDGQPIGIPMIHFRNGGRQNYGVSELRNAAPVQNSLNRAHYSSVIAAELTAFDIYFELGFDRGGTQIMPGMVIQVPGPLTKDQVVDMKKLGPSDLAPILSFVENERRLIGEITSTPSPDMTGASQQSGEYLKQLEVGLVAKVKRFENRAGASWESVYDVAWKIQQAYGTEKPPMYKRWLTRWKSAEVRNSATVVTNAVALDPIWGNKETLRAVAPEYDLTEERIDEILQSKQAQQVQKITQLGKSLPGFGGPVAPTNGTQPGNANSGMQGMMSNMMGDMAAEMNRL